MAPASRPLQNRVLPDGEIVAIADRGTMFGNRGGRIHDAGKRLTRRRWASKHWICCVLSFRGRKREVMAPRSYTELFFLDEATAFAAGHRPCFECRRADANRFAQLFAETGPGGAPSRARVADIDDVLHAERLLPDGGKRVYSARLGDLPGGVIVRHGDGAALYDGSSVLPWATSGYGAPQAANRATAVGVLTPQR
ncbi:MAG: hypothetical protein AAFV26_01320, partial [Pseudomonadota bacterium]